MRSAGRSEMIKEIEKVLQKERMTLLAGDITSLEDLYDKKEKVALWLERNSDSPITESDLRTIRKRLNHNQKLLLAAQDGLKAASGRLDSVLDASNGFRTYTKSLKSRSLGISK